MLAQDVEEGLFDDRDNLPAALDVHRLPQREHLGLHPGQLVSIHVLEGEGLGEDEHLPVDLVDVLAAGGLDPEVLADREDLPAELVRRPTGGRHRDRKSRCSVWPRESHDSIQAGHQTPPESGHAQRNVGRGQANCDDRDDSVRIPAQGSYCNNRSGDSQGESSKREVDRYQAEERQAEASRRLPAADSRIPGPSPLLPPSQVPRAPGVWVPARRVLHVTPNSAPVKSFLPHSWRSASAGATDAAPREGR